MKHKNLRNILLKNLFLFTLIIFIFPFVSASDGFSVALYSGGSDLCTCTSLQDVISITNFNTVPVAYTLKLNQNVRDYTLSKDFFVLEPSETIEVFAFFNPNCGTFGDRLIEITVENNLGQKRLINREISVLNCENNLLNFRVANSFINDPCVETQYPLTIFNTGLFSEFYKFSVEGLASNFVSFDYDSVFLQPGEKLDFNAHILMPCENFGVYTGNFVSTAQTSGLVSKVPFKLTIERNYNFSIAFGFYDLDNTIYYKDDLSYEFCADLTYNIPVKVNNEVFISNSFDVNINSISSDWLMSDFNRFSIHGLESGIFNLTATPSKDNLGNHFIPVTLTSQRGSLSATGNLNIDIIDCSSFTLDLDYETDLCCGKNTFQLTIKNLADITNDITLFSDANLAYSNFSIPPNQSVVVDVDFDLSCFEENNFFITASNFIESKDLNISFNTFSREACHLIILKDRQREIIFYEEKEIPLLFKHEGLKNSEYNVLIEGPEWVSINESSFSLNPSEVKLLSLFVNPLNSTPEGLYNLKISFVSDNGFTHVVEFDLELKEWNFQDATYLFIRDNKGLVILFILILIVIILLLVFVARNFKRSKKSKKEKKIIKPKKEEKQKKETKVVSKLNIENEFKKSKKSKKSDKLKRTFWWIVLFLLFLLFLFFIYSNINWDFILEQRNQTKQLDDTNESYNDFIDDFEDIINETVDEVDVNESFIITPPQDEVRPEEELFEYLVKNNLTTSFLYHHWFKNEVYSINLDNNFVDPDGGSLSYSSSFPENVNVVIDGSIVYLTPREDWTGVDTIFFRATDSAGDFVISPEITLIVRERPIEEVKINGFLSNLGLYTKLYLFYIIIGVLLLIIILIVLKPKKK